MTTCTVSSKKKQATIRGKLVENYEEMLERCWQIPGGFEQKAMAIQIFATPVLCFDSELTLHKETTLTRLDRKVHAILFKTTRWRSQALTFTLLARGHLIHPSQAVKYWGIKNCEKSIARKIRFSRGCQKPYQSKRNQGRATWRSDGAGFSDAPSHESFGVDLVRSLGTRGTTMHLTKGEDQLFHARGNREDLRGIAGTNIDHASTVQMMRAKKTRKRKVRNCGAFARSKCR